MGPTGKRITAALIALALLVGATGFALSQSLTSTSDVRIVAQKLEDGRIEFGLEQDGERILPRTRFFPANAEVGRWLKSSPVTITLVVDDPVVEDEGAGHAPVAGNCASPGDGIEGADAVAAFSAQFGDSLVGCLWITGSAKQYIDLSAGRYTAYFSGEGSYGLSCSVYGESVDGQGFDEFGETSSTAGAQQFHFSVGDGYQHEFDPGLVEISGVACQAVMVVLTTR